MKETLERVGGRFGFTVQEAIQWGRTHPLSPLPVACAACDDAGFVQVLDPALGPGDKGWQRLIPCPSCSTWEKGQRARLLAQSGVGEKNFQRWKYVAEAEEAFQATRALGEEGEGPLFLLIYGGLGCGKSHLARAAARATVERGVPAQYWGIPRLLDRLVATVKTGELEQLMDDLAGLPLLVLDDFGRQKKTEWGDGRLEELIRRRHDAPLATILTTNFGLRDIPPWLVSLFGDREKGRIVFNSAPDFRLTGGGVP